MEVLSRPRIISERPYPKGLLGWLLFAVLCVSPANAQSKPEQPSLILITIDTLRADHISSLNAESPAATPRIDTLIADSASFLQAQTTNPLTTPAHASMMTGMWPPSHGVRDFTGNVLSSDKTTLAETLSAAGFSTAAFVSAAVLDRRTGLSQGFATYGDGFDGFLGSDSRVADRPGPQTIRAAREWLAEQEGKRVFLWLHLYEPHDPYTPPSPYRESYATNPYAGEVAYVDALVGDFLDDLRELGRYDNAVVSLLADHGEGLGDHGESKHGFFVYQSTMHVPWVLKLPGNEYSGKQLHVAVSIADLFPTLLHALSIDRTLWPSELQGESRFRLLRNDEATQSAIYMESETPLYQHGWSDLRSIRQGRYKLIEAPQPELYDLSQDPTEQINLFPSNQALGGSLREALKAFEARLAPAPEAAQSIDPELEEQLRSLGYVGVQAPVRTGASRAGLADPKDRIEVYSQMERGVEAAREKQWDRAIRELSSAARGEPKSAAIASSLAMTFRDAGRNRESIQWFRRTLELEPGDQVMRMRLVPLLLQSGAVAEAKGELEKVIEADPKNFLALFNLGTLAGQQQDFASAIVYFTRASEVREDAGTLRSLAMAQGFAGRFEEARASLERALSLSPDDPGIHQMLGEIYGRLGNQEKSREHLGKATALSGRRPPQG